MEQFKHLVYYRPSLEKTEAALRKELDAFRNAMTYGDAKEAFFRRQEIISEFRTMNVIASIRTDMNTADEFYAEESEFFHAANPKLAVTLKEFNEALTESQFRHDFKREYGSQLFRLLEADIRTNGKEIVDEKVWEGKLVTAYSKTAASCKTVFRGEECNFYGLLKHMLSTDRQERREAMQAWADLYEGAAPELEKQYIQLCEIRRIEAEKLGFDNYIDMAYTARHRFDYTAADIERFHDLIIKYVVPAAAQLHEAQRKRLGVEKLEWYDEDLFFPNGNSTPDKDTKGMVKAAQKMYRELSKETGEFFDSMVEADLFDLETRPNKRLGGYCTRLAKYKMPFIFSNFNKTSADTEVLTHEAGHAFEGYVASRCQEISEYYGSTAEVNEIHSMAMEFFTEPWYDLFYPEGEGKRYVYEHLVDSFANITYLVSVDDFQHRVFEGEEKTAADLKQIWKQTEQKYLPWRSYDGNEFLENGGFWMQKQHIFMYPFYYVEYALAMLCALQFYLKRQSDPEGAWADYMTLCRLGGSLGYFDLLKAANLKNPFEEETICEVTEAVMNKIAEIEKTL
ncbi:MAG: M3 family oligoendopeptidase [Erysipelotrichaceae bacterium]|nr:M3 family oligoendopeptidase [Erysipelotrichaceae bacterium]